MSRTHKFLGGLVPTYVYQVAMMVTGIWLTPFFLHHLGQQTYGLWIVGTQLLMYLTLTDFGVVGLLPIETAAAIGRGGGAEHSEELPQVVGQTVRLVLYQLPIVALVALCLWLWIPPTWQGLKGPLAVLLAGFVVSFPLRILPVLSYGLQDLVFANTMQIVGWACSTALNVVLVLAGWNLYALATGWVVGQIAFTPVFAYRLWTRFPNAVPKRLPALVWETTKKQLENGFWVSVAQVAQLLVAGTDVVVIARFLGPAAVVPFTCTGKLVNVLGNQAKILMHTAGPGLCELRASGARDRIFDAVVALSRGMFIFLGMVCCVVLMVNRWFVDWWVTAHQYGGAQLTLLFVLTLLVRQWTGMTANNVFYFGHQRRISLTNISDGLVTLASMFVLVRIWGVAGALMGSMLGAIVVSLPLNLWIVARDAGVSLPRLVGAMLGGWFWRFALVAAITGLVSLRWSPKTPISGIGTSAVVAVVYLAIMAPDALRPPLGNYLRPLLESFRSKYLVRGVAASNWS